MTFEEWLGNKYLGSMEIEFSKDAFYAGAASRDAEVAELVELYEQALTASWPDGAMGDAFEYWNYAREAIASMKEQK